MREKGTDAFEVGSEGVRGSARAEVESLKRGSNERFRERCFCEGSAEGKLEERGERDGNNLYERATPSRRVLDVQNSQVVRGHSFQDMSY